MHAGMAQDPLSISLQPNHKPKLQIGAHSFPTWKPSQSRTVGSQSSPKSSQASKFNLTLAVRGMVEKIILAFFLSCSELIEATAPESPCKGKRILSALSYEWIDPPGLFRFQIPHARKMRWARYSERDDQRRRPGIGVETLSGEM
jgi:hypothetical protein